MSRRTKLIALAIFALLLGIPLGYLALTWHPTSPLTFHLKPSEPTVPGNNHLGDYRARWVRIENSTFASTEFHRAIVLVKAGPLVFRDAPPGMVLVSSLTTTTPKNYQPFLVVPARGHIVTDAALAPGLVDEISKDNAYVLYQWQSLPRSKAASVAEWLHEHGPAWARDYIPQFHPWEDVIPLGRSTAPFCEIIQSSSTHQKS